MRILISVVLALLIATAAISALAQRGGASAAKAVPVSISPTRTDQPLSTSRSWIVAFENSPFPYRGKVPVQNTPFLDAASGKRWGHRSDRGGILWERPTFNDRRTLLYIPKGFDARRPALIVVYFHGNYTEIAHDVRDRQQLPRQLGDSGLNAVLVAPQFALNAADSSAGRFWQPGAFRRYLEEAVRRLAQLHGGDRAQTQLANAPVVFVAYSGGYHPAIYAAQLGGIGDRLRGMILLDAPYGEEEMLAGWVIQHRTSFFLSAYSNTARASNQLLQGLLRRRGIYFVAGSPAQLEPGTVAFYDVGENISHFEFVTNAGFDNPVQSLLARVTGFPQNAVAANGADAARATP